MRLLPCLLVAAAAIAAGVVSACGGGSAASPTFSSETTPEDAGSDAPSNAALVAIFAACGTSPATGSIPADVAAVLTDKCQPCHTTPMKNGAPFPLLTYEDVHAAFTTLPAIPRYEEMYMLIQPGADPHMPFGNAPQLTADQFQTLGDWLMSCAPPGE